MRKRTAKQLAEQRGVLLAVMTVLAFLVLVALAIGGVFLFHMNGDFYSALEGELGRGFYLSAALILIFSSVLFTPFSYGISYYFIRSARDRARFSDLFFLFRTPVLLTKATVVSIFKKVLIYLERLLLLAVAALLEVALFFAFLVVTGEDIFAVQDNPFRLAADFMMRSPWLIGLSILLWSGVLFGILLINLRYILCKYVLICYPDTSPLQAMRVGRGSIRGRMMQTLFFYLRYGAHCVLMVVTLGFASGTGHRGFSVYACELVEHGWRSYCSRRSLRPGETF